MIVAPGFVRAGKVRDLYDLGDDRLLMVASDRLSAFDVVLPTPIADKGRVLTGLSRFWFAEAADLVPNHLLGTDPADLPPAFAAAAADLRGRSMICRRLEIIPVECVVRGYLAGSGWKDYRATGRVSGIALPAGLQESDRLPEPLFTPSTKAEAGHDEPIDFDTVVALVGGERAEAIRDVALGVYARGATVCARAGILLADTKLEMGVDGATGELVLADEVLTPDSSRFWDAAQWAPGGPQASYDKQFVRDWLEAQRWDRTAPGPELPPDVVAGTRARYVGAFERITGASFARYLEEDVVAP
ncbi:MAG TPA: phosphoribosylaminoimidazolesuccinocarboxamide synthase [Candidatus Nanopelagicales bacterium]|nr:phosphoribosylaminoimidazolesuccinocarboxamide synthase [Candidatus Nanopelagicales bacterium]